MTYNVFSGTLNPTQFVSPNRDKALNEAESTDPNEGRSPDDLILASSTVYLLTEWHQYSRLSVSCQYPLTL